MSTKANGGSGNKKNKAVRFASSKDDDRGDRPTKRPRIDRPNVDEDDDVDEWINDEGGDDDGTGTTLPSQRELVNAKRNRRLKRQGQDGMDDDDEYDNANEEETHVDKDTSLMAERQKDDNDIPVEPFNMKAERSDGSGYFEGDTYIFRKKNEDGEPDAWLDSLNDANDDKKGSPLAKPRAPVERKRDETMDDWTKEELYAAILPLVSDSETILQALVRYGNLIKRRQTKKQEATTLAQKALSQLTEASNALLLQGDVDIYQMTRHAIVKMVPDKPPVKKPLVQWEYKGNQDGQIHGPYSTVDMLGWTQAGYFIGAQAVQIRTVAPDSGAAAAESPSKTTTDDLLSDLMDDDDDEEEDVKKEPSMVRGEWVSSNDVNFKAYS